jgi:hypothetical protein
VQQHFKIDLLIATGVCALLYLFGYLLRPAGQEMFLHKVRRQQLPATIQQTQLDLNCKQQASVSVVLLSLPHIIVPH